MHDRASFHSRAWAEVAASRWYAECSLKEPDRFHLEESDDQEHSSLH
jgi:hypothetical protein